MMHRHPYLSIGKGDYIKSIVSLANIIDMTVFSLSIIKPGAQYFNCVDKPYITVRKLMELIAENSAFTIPKLIIPVWFAVLIGKVFDIPAKLLNIDIPINSDRMRKLATATDFASESIREAGYIQLQSTADAIKETTDWYLSIKDKRKL
jgi:nucleoside-diphosphate-sugar epimerase